MDEIKPKFNVGETAYIMRYSEIKKVIITECYIVGNDIIYYCHISGCKIFVGGISEKYIFKSKAALIIDDLLKKGCVEIEYITGNVYKITINETEE